MQSFFLRSLFGFYLFVSAANTFSQAPALLPVERFSEAIQIETVSHSDSFLIAYDNYTRFLHFLKRSYPLTHEHLQPKAINKYSLLFSWQGSNKSQLPILYMAHYDVVPVDSSTIDNWKEQPFSGIISDGFIWGRGTVDDKIGIIGLMEACERLLQENHQPQRSVYIAFGHDEEIGGRKGALAISNYLKEQNIFLEAVIDEGGAIAKDIFPGLDKPVALIGTAEKGDMNVLLLVEDGGGHSSAPHENTAIYILSEALTRLKNNPMPLRLTDPTRQMLKFVTPHLDGKTRFAVKNMWLFKKKILKKMSGNNVTNALVRTVITPTIIRGGVKENALPNNAMASVNIRTLPGDSLGNVLEHIRKTINNSNIRIIVTGSRTEASPVSSSESQPYHAMKKIIQEHFPEAIVSPVLSIGASDSRHFSRLSNNVLRFIPVVIEDEEKQMIHGYNERISIAGFEKAMQFYYELIKKMDGIE